MMMVDYHEEGESDFDALQRLGKENVRLKQRIEELEATIKRVQYVLDWAQAAGWTDTPFSICDRIQTVLKENNDE